MGQRWRLRSSRAISACSLVVAPMSALCGRSPPVTRAARGCAAITGRPARPVSKASRPHYAMTEPPQSRATGRQPPSRLTKIRIGKGRRPPDPPINAPGHCRPPSANSPFKQPHGSTPCVLRPRIHASEGGRKSRRSERSERSGPGMAIVVYRVDADLPARTNPPVSWMTGCA
jgi:hypothetical protein